ncbi:MAG: EamA family transporter, partial [Lentisphaeria bacterium]|nr:EamA family transporter [Lentisphaeria bacterium]
LVDVLLGSWIWFCLPLKLSQLPLGFYATLAGTALSETLYCVGLVMAYRKMDMSAAYPMMRSLPLLFTALLTALFGWGEPLSLLAKIGMVTVFAGCLIMPLGKFADFKLANYLDKKILFVLLAATGTTLYTMCDSRAQEIMRASVPTVSGTMISFTYYELRHLAVMVPIGILVLAQPSARAEAMAIRRNGLGAPMMLAGVFAGLTYLLVLLAMNEVSNVSYVQAFRQLGLVIGMLEGIFILKERCTLTRVVGIVLIVSGLVMSVLKIG